MALAATGIALRGLVASAWGVARYGGPTALPERLPVSTDWNLPDAGRQDPQRDYDEMRKGLRDDNWVGLKDATPWHWMLALMGILDGMAPRVLDAPGDNPLQKVYEHLRRWQSAQPEAADVRQWTWPYDGMPTYDVEAWCSLLNVLPRAALHVDAGLGLVVRQVAAPAFRRHRDNSGFTDAESQQWTLAQLQYTGLGLTDSVARVQRGSRRLVTWTEVRRRADEELLSVHTLDDKLGRWWRGQHEAVPEPAQAVQMAESLTAMASAQNEEAEALASLSIESDGRRDRTEAARALTSGLGVDAIRDVLRQSQRASWLERGRSKSQHHMRIAMLQWCIDESYSHPLAEVGLGGMGLQERACTAMRKALVEDSAMAKAGQAAVRGKEYTWRATESTSVPSWPEHRRRSLLRRALDACQQLKVDLLVLPEVSVRRETVNWLEDELRRQHPGLAVLAGTYRHFGKSVDDRGRAGAGGGDVHPLMAPLTLLWRPDEELSKALFAASKQPPETLRFWRGKKYRAVAANEFFRPDWNALKPLFRVEQLFEQLAMPSASDPNRLGQLKALTIALAEALPPLRYCMELICSELFLLTSPANIEPLRKEAAAMLKRFPDATVADDANAMVIADQEAVGKTLSVLQERLRHRRTVLLVPAATKRSNDYWHAGQASVLASGTATVFCNAAKSDIACGGSCFIGIDSATKPHSEKAGLIETLTPYHGWRKGILTARADGALSEADQALVVVDIDPVHVVTGRPRPQLLPEPMALVAYLPVVELLDPEANKVALYQSLSMEYPAQIKAAANVQEMQEVQAALATVATSPHCSKTVVPGRLWSALHGLREAGKLDCPELDAFVKLFSDSKAVRERLLTWDRDRHQQPYPASGPLNREPAWLDFLDVDLTLKEGQTLPSIAVPPWSFDAGALADGDVAPEQRDRAVD